MEQSRGVRARHADIPSDAGRQSAPLDIPTAGPAGGSTCVNNAVTPHVHNPTSTDLYRRSLNIQATC